MADLLLTHGYFLYDDPKELKIMKPYVPLGILYICSHLRNKGFDVQVFDTTFSTLEDLTRHLQTETPSVLGVYANLMTRKKVVEIVRIARQAGCSDWTVRSIARKLSGDPRPLKAPRVQRRRDDDYRGGDSEEPLGIAGWGIVGAIAAVFFGAIWWSARRVSPPEI